MSVLSTGLAKTSAAAGGYSIDNSLRFNDDDSAYLNRTFGTATNRKKWTWSGWVKRGNLGTNYAALFLAGSTSYGGGGTYSDINFTSGNGIRIRDNLGGGYNLVTTQVFRDCSSWYHIIVSVDTSQVTSSDRVKLYVNGSQVTSFSTETYCSQDFEGNANSSITHAIGRRDVTYHDNYLSEVHFIDGQALDHTSFGETGTYGEWKPIEVTGMTYGTNGFYLDFSNSSSLGTDASSNTNNWTVNNLQPTDQMLDSPTNNFATFSGHSKSSYITLSEGGLRVDWSATAEGGAASTFKLFDGCYVEFYITGIAGSYPEFGIRNLDDWGQDANRYNNGGFVSADGSTRIIGTSTGITKNGTPSTNSYTTGDVIQVAYKSGKVYVGKNNTWMNSGNPVTETGQVYNTTKELDIVFRCYSTGEFITNFGQDSSFAGNKTAQGNQDSNSIGDFYYEPPTDFLALCTSNLPDPAVIPSEHFNTVLYTGNSSTQSITGVGFQPDLCWNKSRSHAEGTQVNDAVRGAGTYLVTYGTDAENTVSASLTSFDSDGFSLGADNDTYQVNKSGYTYVAWNWKANGTGVSNTSGSITSTVSANADAGFSIVSYTGTGANATVGHGLSSAPELMFFKNRIDAEHWTTYSEAIGNTKYLYLNQTAAAATYNYWQNTSPTNSLFYLTNQGDNNGSGDGMIAYCFHSVEGYSKVGSYTGNGSTDGTFVYTGFRPAYVMIKIASGADNWGIFDVERETYNTTGTILRANSSGVEESGSAWYVDLLSNGFKARSLDSNMGTNAATYIYLAFAEQPFKHTNAR